MSTAVADPPGGEQPSPAAPPPGRKRRQRSFHLDLLALCRVLVLGFFTLFLIIPLLSMVVVAFTGETVNIFGSLVDGEIRDQNISDLGGASFATFIETVGSAQNMEALRNSLLLALGVALLAMLLCTPIAYGFARTAMPFKRTLGVLCTIPMVVPTFAAAGGFITMFGQAGWVTGLWQQVGGSGQLINPYSMTGLVLVLLFFLFPFALWPMVAAFRISSAQVEEASSSLGARSVITFLTVTLPLALPSLLSALLLIFATTFSDFGAAIILGIDGLNLIVVQAYREIAGFYNWAAGSVLVMVMVVVVALFFALQRMVLRGRDYGTLSARGGQPAPLVRHRGLCTGLSVFTTAFTLIPVLSLVSVLVLSFATTWRGTLLPDSFTLAHYERVLDRSWGAIANSLTLAGGALLIALFVASTVAYYTVRHRAAGLDFLATMPLIVPGIALALALMQTFNTQPLALYGTALLLVVGYAIRRLPYMVRPTVGAMQAIGTDVEEAARSLGANRITAVMTTVLPLLRPALFAGGILVFVTVLKETSLTVLIAPSNWEPMSRDIFNNLLRGERYPAAAMSVILLVIVISLQQIAYKFSRNSLY
ncbi:ABC transporter permease [Nocardiopsis coralli]|uniref:ABC transporter permease n=1 Tax=Nocardiopsis coralli TaxID=2772213 RepID=UPI002E2C10BA|nr:iron ABC transporter permease [Nocardiopsis coralli]